ncbi:hypothetical protein DLREEDagrD3_00990 [Denitratisoma sp. agr-D3]
MRGRALSLLLLCLAAPALARELPPRPVVRDETSGQPSGYVFANPQLLAQQLVWGIFHGVRLLGLACQERGDTTAAEAYVAWLERQQARIHAAERDLARHYFKRERASAEAISAALLLKPTLDTPPELLAAACASLPRALQQERYDLEKFYAARRAAIEKGDPDFPGAIWVEPADAIATPAEAESASTASGATPDNEGQP